MRERLVWLDLLRGVLLLLICIGHFNDYPSFVEFIIKPTAMYYVPMFYMISGYLFNPNNSFKDYFFKKTKSLLIPYLFFSALFILMDWNTYIHPLSAIKENLYQCLILGKGVSKSSPLWFVIVLYFSSLIIFMIRKLFVNQYAIVIIIALLSIMAYIFSVKMIEFPLLIHLIPSTVTFMAAGYLFKLFSKRKFFWYAVSIIIGFWGMFIDLGDMHLNRINNYPMFFIYPMIFTFGIINAFNTMSSFIEKSRFLKIFTWISKNGIVILSCHCWLIFIFSVFIGQIPIIDNNVWILFISKLVFVMLGLYLFFVPIINKYCYIFLGKKQSLHYKESLIL